MQPINQNESWCKASLHKEHSSFKWRAMVLPMSTLGWREFMDVRMNDYSFLKQGIIILYFFSFKQHMLCWSLFIVGKCFSCEWGGPQASYFDYYAFRWIYRLSYLYYALFAVIVSLVTGIVVTAISSYFTGKLLIEGCLSLHKSSN